MDRKRSVVSLLTASSFVVLAVTGVLAFARPFSISVVGLHSLMGFVFVGLIGLHLTNNSRHLGRYLRSRLVWATTALVLAASALFFWQPTPVKRLLSLSQNLGPALERFEMSEADLSLHYHPAPSYHLALSIRTGPAFDLEPPPSVAIWLENASFYHIKTLYPAENATIDSSALPYWDYKVRGWETAMREAEAAKSEPADPQGVDAVSGPTRNSSFDPADYLVPSDSELPMPYRLCVEINQPGDRQASLVYAVEIDNADPRTYQVLELMGYPKREEDRETGEASWDLYYVDEGFDSALQLIDSALVTIDRGAAE